MLDEMRNGSAIAGQRQPQEPASTGLFRSLSLRSLVALAVAMLVLPLWGYGLFVSWQYARAERAAIEGDGTATARGIANAVSFHMRALQGTLRALEESTAATDVRWDELFIQATAFAKAQDAVIGLGDAQGNQIFNTNAPFGAPLPPMLPESGFHEAIITGTPQVSDLLFGNVTRTWLLAIARRIQRQDDQRFALVIAVDSARHLDSALGSVRMPKRWTVAVIDSKGLIAGQRPQPERVGQPAPADVQRIALAAPSARGLASTITGEKALIFTHRAEGTGWTIVVGVPENALSAAVKANVEKTLLFGFLILLVSIGLSVILSNRFSRKFEDLSRLALAYRDRTQAVTTRPYRVRELAELQRILVLAQGERDYNEVTLRQLIADKELLMQEVHHRVKNSLQLVQGLLSLQARNTGNPEAKAALEAASSRIITIAHVHNHLYVGDDITEIMVDDYLVQLTAELGASLFLPGSERRIRVRAPHSPLRTDAMTHLGLIATELVTNSAKYGAGPIDVQFHIEDGAESTRTGVLAISDRGEGFPEDFAFDHTGGLGSRLIENLVRSTGGTVDIQKRAGGSRVVVRYPLGSGANQA